MFRRTVLITTTVALAAGLALSGCSAPGTTTAPAADTASSPAKAPAPSTPGLNTPVKAGAFEYTAVKVSDAGATIGTSPFTQTAQGTYLQVEMKIENVGTSANTFIVNYVKLVDADGKTFDPDATATLYANPDQNAWIAAINPGNAIQGPIVFDVPAGTKAVSVQVSDNMFRTGETISLG